MKKLILALATLMVLVGCSDAFTNISFDETLFSVEGSDVSQKDLYNVMKQYDAGVMGSAIVIDNARELLVDSIEIDDEMKENAEEQLTFIKEMLGDEYLEVIENIGFDTEEEYLEEIIYPELKYQKLVKEELIEDFETLNEEFGPREVRILELKEDSAKDALKEIKDGKEFEEVAKKNALIDSPFNGSKQVHLLKTTQLPEVLTEFLTKNDTPTLSDVLTDEEMDTAYIVQIIEVDANRFKDDVLNAYLENEQLAQEYEGTILRSNNFKVYDRDLYDSIMESNPAYLEENTEDLDQNTGD